MPEAAGSGLTRRCSNRELADFLGAKLSGPEAAIEWVNPFPNRQPNSVSYLAATALSDVGQAQPGTTVIAASAVAAQLLAAGYAVIESQRPKFDLARGYSDFLAETPSPAVHPSAAIGPDVVLAEDVSIGPGAVLDGEIVVGKGSRIGANTVLHNRVVVGSHVRILNGCVIGGDAYSFGFDFEGPGQGRSVRFPCFGRVVIDDFVEIGNNCVISRGVFDDTHLHESSRVNDLAHIGNTVTLGRNSMVMANCDISARVVIGEGCWIAQSAAIRQQVSVGDGAQVGMGSVVTHDVPAGKIVMGVPARVVRDR